MEFLTVKHKPLHDASHRDIFLLPCDPVSHPYNISTHPFFILRRTPKKYGCSKRNNRAPHKCA